MSILCLFALTGCVAHNPNLKSYMATDMPQFSVEDATTDIANAMSYAYPPGQTTLMLATGDRLLIRAWKINYGPKASKWKPKR